MHETQGVHVIQIDELTRVEGQGALYIKIDNGNVVETRFKIFEPPRFFEGFLRGRGHQEVPDITARICGICPVAYQMSSCHALESIFGALPESGSAIAELRRLFYCGEWVESHALHVFFLNLPDFMGTHNAIEIGKTHPDLIERGIRVRKAGNALLRRLGGRPMHPVGAAVGGWHHMPSRMELLELAPQLEQGIDDCASTARWIRQNIRIPEFQQEYEFIALRDGGRYPFNEGRATSSRGWDCGMAEWEEKIEERQVEYSNAYQAVLRESGTTYFLGPVARFNLNCEFLTPRARELAAGLGLEPPVQNPYQGILVRLVEMAYCFEEALRIIESYQRPAAPQKPLHIQSGEGAWITEAPRGMLYHRYRTNPDGTIAEAKIIPPTSQNQARIELDLTALVRDRLGDSDHDLSHACEFMIRNYDPCISCATHFLSFRIDR